DLIFSEKFACITCGTSYPEITPRMFSFNNPQGACPSCDGIGARLFFDPDLIVPDESLTLRDGAIDPWEKRNGPFYQVILEALAAHFKFGMLVPYKKEFEGVLENLERRLHEYERRRREEGHAGGQDGFEAAYEEFHRYMNRSPCDDCEGTRLRKEARFVTVGDLPIHKLTGLPIRDAYKFF